MEREAFEKFTIGRGVGVTIERGPDDEYIDRFIWAMWIAWQARAALNAPPAASADWVLVPREITLEMQHAYFAVIDKNMARVETDPRFGRHSSNSEAYRAMLAAAPISALPPSAPAVAEEAKAIVIERIRHCLDHDNPDGTTLVSWMADEILSRLTAKREGSK